jgi:hypothetical protein
MTSPACIAHSVHPLDRMIAAVAVETPAVRKTSIAESGVGATKRCRWRTPPQR